jgi:hypothetical protein
MGMVASLQLTYKKGTGSRTVKWEEAAFSDGFFRVGCGTLRL